METSYDTGNFEFEKSFVISINSLSEKRAEDCLLIKSHLEQQDSSNDEDWANTEDEIFSL